MLNWDMELKAVNIVLAYIVISSVLQYQVSSIFWSRRRRRRPPPPPPRRDCQVGQWSSWSACSHRCGTTGMQTRIRSKTVTECCGGTCPYILSGSRSCNRYACKNGGTSIPGRCSCPTGWTGTCCEIDVNECSSHPCQHICVNVPGSFNCKCQPCYTKRGVRCELKRCKFREQCVEYGDVNPENQCQDCQKSRETVWTNNNTLSCNDNNLCTRNDRCMDGACNGTAFLCRECEGCDSNGCKIKPGFCVIEGKCYHHGDLRPGKPCQQCNSNNPTKWTANNNLACSDNDVTTRNDRCTNGACQGEPFTCLTCQNHYNDACQIKNGYCIIKYHNIDTCFAANTEKLCKDYPEIVDAASQTYNA